MLICSQQLWASDWGLPQLFRHETHTWYGWRAFHGEVSRQGRVLPLGSDRLIWGIHFGYLISFHVSSRFWKTGLYEAIWASRFFVNQCTKGWGPYIKVVAYHKHHLYVLWSVGHILVGRLSYHGSRCLRRCTMSFSLPITSSWQEAPLYEVVILKVQRSGLGR